MSELRAERHSWPIKAAAGATGFIMMVSGCAQPNSVEQSFQESENHNSEVSDDTFAAQLEIAPTLPAPSTCLEPSTADVMAVETLLAQPRDPALEMLNSGGKGSDESYQAYKAWYDRLVDEHDLTIIDGNPTLSILNQDYAKVKGGEELSPFVDYLVPAQDFMSQFGVTLEVGIPKDGTNAYGAVDPTPEELELPNTKRSVVNVVSAFSGQPKEYIRDIAGVKRVRLVSAPLTMGGYVGDWTESDGTVYINVNKGLAEEFPMSGVLHEIYHLADQAQCQGGDNSIDFSFDKLNQGKPVYNGIAYDPSVPNYEEYNNKVGLLNTQYIEAKEVGNTAMICNIAQVKDNMAAEVLTLTQYHPDAGEDKAELGEIVSQPYRYGEISSSRFKILSQKFKFLLARMYKMDPGLVEFWIETASRPYEDPAESVC